MYKLKKRYIEGDKPTEWITVIKHANEDLMRAHIDVIFLEFSKYLRNDLVFDEGNLQVFWDQELIEEYAGFDGDDHIDLEEYRSE